MKFECKRCGACCYGDWWDAGTFGLITSLPERVRMADHLSLELDDFHAKFAPNGMIRVVPHCTLFDPETKSCAVDRVKPNGCRKWPYLTRFVRDKENLKKAARLCPGVTLEDGDLEVGRLAPITHPSPGSE